LELELPKKLDSEEEELITKLALKKGLLKGLEASESSNSKGFSFFGKKK
jgi:hypothetical protein